MSGKAYTIKELKGIVDYLVEHKAYKELRGRKMWMDFANSPSTVRTWQSLKETFLKRILPDIYNPYYKLTSDQIRSFKQGHDVKAREQNKLEIHTSEDATSYAENEKDNEKPSTSKAINAEKTTGEDIKPSKISSRNRSSVDTIVLENCYETADDLLRDLESPNVESSSKSEVSKSPSKSLRDLITYSEPLTPMLQEVLHDFATDEETDSEEPRMQIVETVPESDEGASVSPRRVPDTDNKSQKQNGNAKCLEKDSDESESFVPPKVKSLKLRKRQGVYVPVSEAKSPSKKLTIDELPEVSKQSSTAKRALLEEVSEPVILNDSDEQRVHEMTKAPVQSTQNCSNSTNDTVLPNNQEALDNTKPENKTTDETSKTETNYISKITRKRAISQDMSSNSHLQGKKVDSKGTQKQVSMSDGDVGIKKLQVNKKADSAKELNNNQGQSHETNVTDKSPDIDTQDIMPPNKPVENKDFEKSTQSSQINPCLQSVSLFAEQFNLINSESSNENETVAEVNQKKPDEAAGKTEKVTADVINDVVMLKSHSESDSDTSKEQAKKNSSNKVLNKPKRNIALANVFGFSSGGVVTTKRRKRTSFRQSTSSHHYQRSNSSDDSSEWTSESDSDYVSPPRGRRNRMRKKYLKPRSARIHALEEEGGLFVMHGKKIYPLVKDGKSVKNYLIYSPDSDPEEDDNYWKQKYVKESRRVEELKTLIQQNRQIRVRDSSPLLPTRSSRNQIVTEKHNRGIPQKSVLCVDSDKEPTPMREVEKKEPTAEPKNKTLKITFAKNNQEVHLEGHWSQLHPVLADVVEIFHKDVVAYTATAKKDEPDRPIHVASDKSSVVLTPIDEDVHEKVNQLETEIFKEIQERDQEEHVERKEPSEGNVTKRKRVNRMSSSSTDASVAPNTSLSSRISKRAKVITKTDVEPVKELENNNIVEGNVEDEKSDVNNIVEVNVGDEKSDVARGRETPSVDTIDSKANTSAKRTRTPRKQAKETTTEEVKTVTATQFKMRTRKAITNLAKDEPPNQNKEDEDVRYMLPPAQKVAGKSATNVRKSNRRSSIKIPNIYISANVSLNSESAQDYLDSDTSPPIVKCKRKRRLSLSTVITKNKNKHKRMKRNSCPVITNDVSSDSNNSYHIILKTTDDCSLKSDEYRSESYQLLMPHRKNTFTPLEKIEENCPLYNDKCDSRERRTLSNSEIVKDYLCTNINDDLTSSGNTDFVNTSSVSLPLSPELSIVESLSISQKLIESVNSQPTLNEIDAKDLSENAICNKYLMSQVDVTMPLMQQECGVHRSFHGTLPADHTCNETKDSVVSESFLNKVNTVNIDEAPINEASTLYISLDQRLKNLLLESAKKMSISAEDQVVNPVAAVNKEKNMKKPRPKRCSTPRKRKDTQKSKLPKVDPVIEEQHMETYSYCGRKSCPPSIQIINHENVENDIQKRISTKDNTVKELLAKEKPKPRKKKDIIKVKILRPKSKPQKNEKNEINTKSICRTSVPTDSGINENESGLSIQDLSASIDLIHNHSETCLHANDCIGDSVEFMELTAKSIVSINSSASCDCKAINEIFKECSDLPENFCHNAQDCSRLQNVKAVQNTQSTGDTVYHSPANSEKSINSLLTEDLSYEFPQPSQPTKWYLLDDDDTNITNTNAGVGCPQNMNMAYSSYGSNLKQIFPIACAVPDLSTITEMSKENDENSRKPTLDLNYDNNTMNDVDSQNIFDMN